MVSPNYNSQFHPHGFSRYFALSRPKESAPKWQQFRHQVLDHHRTPFASSASLFAHSKPEGLMIRVEWKRQNAPSTPKIWMNLGGSSIALWFQPQGIPYFFVSSDHHQTISDPFPPPLHPHLWSCAWKCLKRAGNTAPNEVLGRATEPSPVRHPEGKHACVNVHEKTGVYMYIGTSFPMSVSNIGQSWSICSCSLSFDTKTVHPRAS